MKSKSKQLATFFKNNKEELYYSNMKTIRGITLFIITALITFSIITILTFEDQEIVMKLISSYFTLIIIMIFYLLMVSKVINDNNHNVKLTSFLTYSLILILNIFIIGISVFISKVEVRPTFFMILVIIAPTMLVINHSLTYFSIILPSIIFVILSYFFRFDSFLNDLYFASATIIIGLPYNLIFYRIKLEDAQLRKIYLEQANIDSLTSLPNRRAFNSFISSIVGDFKQYSFMMSIIDLDNFKTINDTHGHNFGDYIITEFAHLLKEFADENQMYASRLGGDEFVLIGLDYQEVRANAILEELRDKIRDLKLEKNITMTASIGSFFTINPNQYTYDELFNFADEALYSIKKNNKDMCKLIIDEH